ncbi:MAG: endonuclease Q family protein, partial [Minisyncoccales bacterium]
GNLKADGRPILGLQAKELLKIVLDISSEAFLVPAHAWTPWFSLFGSKSGFDSIEECFEELSGEIFSLETGLSSDPPMNWRLSALDRIALISNSDSHSLFKIGREANVFDLPKIDFFGLKEAIKKKDEKKFLFTIEFFPEEGKYHFDGHRFCNLRFSPSETKREKGICPVCKKPLTIGVLHRVELLADRAEGFVPSKAIPFRSLLPLSEIIAQAVGLLENSKKVKEEYERLIKIFGNEMNILLFLPLEDLEEKMDFRIFQGIKKVREGKVDKEPGYDGVYGKIKINFNEEKRLGGQKSLF